MKGEQTPRQRSMRHAVEAAFESVFCATGKTPDRLSAATSVWFEFGEFCEESKFEPCHWEVNGVPMGHDAGLPAGNVQLLWHGEIVGTVSL